LKLTIQQFYRPGGDSTQNRGVVSDVELPSLTTELDVGESDLDYALAFDRVQALQHDDYHMEESPLVQSLKARSQSRVKDSDFFAREERRINHYKEEKKAKTVTLNREKFDAERKELNSDKEEEKIYDDLSDPNRAVFKMDDYDKEALNITIDYLNALGGNKVALAHAGASQQAWSNSNAPVESAAPN
jgi:carboxyl-terminal processing protease